MECEGRGAMGHVALGELLTAGVGRVSIILLVTGGIAAVYGVLELVGVAPRRNVIGGRNLDRRIQSLVIVLIGAVLVILGLVLR
jgi:hypothetical protein